jgi:tRNA (guanine26-N2/guanine27-N2)-dimethyltransferase
MSNVDINSTDEKIYEKISEGKACVYFRKTQNDVFYNPVQEFNRDLSVAVLNTYSSVNNEKKLRILEAFAASGIRSIRYGLEIANCKEIVANDFDTNAVQLIDKNVNMNKVDGLVKSNYGDAIAYMNEQLKSKTRFDCIDLDPYGLDIGESVLIVYIII